VKGLSRGRYDVADTTRQLQKRKMDREAQVGELSGFLKLWFLQQEAGVWRGTWKVPYEGTEVQAEKG
jgi:hypothetical protein